MISSIENYTRFFGLAAMMAILVALVPDVLAGPPVNKDAVAVIIGNRTYIHPDVPEVAFAHNDAAAMRRYVMDVLGVQERNIIHLRDASQGDLERALGNERSHKGDMWRLVRKGRSDVFVFYSGHGMPGLDDGRAYLLPSDADPVRAEINGYPLDVLYKNLEKLKARSVFVAVDACFSGSSHKGTLAPAASITIAPVQKSIVPDGMTVLTAAGPTEIASWDLDAQHGLFTEQLLRAVYGAGDAAEFGGNWDGQVTADEVKRYLDEEMTYAAKRILGRDQTATLNGNSQRVLAVLPGGSQLKRPQIVAAPSKPDSKTESKSITARLQQQAVATQAKANLNGDWVGKSKSSNCAEGDGIKLKMTVKGEKVKGSGSKGVFLSGKVKTDGTISGGAWNSEGNVTFKLKFFEGELRGGFYGGGDEACDGEFRFTRAE